MTAKIAIRSAIGGFFAPHYSSALGHGFDSWAGTLDARLLLPARLEFSGSFYRGQALGGIGGGAFKDVAYTADTGSPGYYFRPLADVGGWAQLTNRLSERLEFNAAFGVDNAFADELRRYAAPGATAFQNLARNHTYTGNVIYSPSAYLQFSLEYRYLESFFDQRARLRAAISSVLGRGIDFDEKRKIRRMDSLRRNIGAGDRVRSEPAGNRSIIRVKSSHRLLIAGKAPRCASRRLA